MATMEMKIEGFLADRILHAANVLELSPCEFVNQLLSHALRSSNQTENEWMEQASKGELGTGLFLVPDIENSEYGRVRKVLVPNLTYDECGRRGTGICIFKWVPHSVRLYEELAAGTCTVEKELEKPDEKIMTPQEPEKIMTPQEVVAYIETQSDWSSENKLAVQQLYQTYISYVSRYSGHSAFVERLARWREQLRGFGLKV